LGEENKKIVGEKMVRKKRKFAICIIGGRFPQFAYVSGTKKGNSRIRVIKGEKVSLRLWEKKQGNEDSEEKN